MNDAGFNRYLFEYRHDGAEWGIEIVARSPQEAKERIKSLAWATYQGEVKAKVYIPTGGFIWRWLRRGMAGVDAVIKSQPHQGTYLGRAVDGVNRIGGYDRVIVITDEQSADKVPDPTGKGYMVNVASNKNGVGYGKWVHLDGFSEAIIRWIAEVENGDK